MKSRGFTLIELMIVIAIIGLMAAIALPRFANTSEKAKVAQVQGNLTNMRTSIAMFFVRTGAFPQFDYTEDQDLNEVENSDKTVRFTDYYSKGYLPKSPAFNDGTIVVNSTNIVYDINGTVVYEGGWTYDVDNGDIFAAIKQRAYGDNTDWSEF